MLRLQVMPALEGYEASGVFCSPDPIPTYRFQSTKLPELRFRARLVDEETEVELALV